nr:DUF3102 domain-containing protein [Paenibacillus sp. VTT E-133291]
MSTLTAEIHAYKRVAGEAIFEIGRRLKHVKDNGLAHGDFGKWLESVEIDRTLATRIMRIVEELGEAKYATWHNLGQRVLYEIATLPPEERTQPHTIPSTGATKTVDEMTVRELREVYVESPSNQRLSPVALRLYPRTALARLIRGLTQA